MEEKVRGLGSRGWGRKIFFVSVKSYITRYVQYILNRLELYLMYILTKKYI